MGCQVTEVQELDSDLKKKKSKTKETQENVLVYRADVNILVYIGCDTHPLCMDGRLSLAKTILTVGMMTISVLFDCWGGPANMEHNGKK